VPSAGLVNGKFIDENPLTGTPGSLIPADWGNGVTQEILNVIKAGDLTGREEIRPVVAGDSERFGQGLESGFGATDRCLPTATVATPDGRLAITPAAVSTGGGRVSIPAGVLISLGQEVVAGQLGRARTFTTQVWSSPDLLPSTGYFLRAQVIAGALTFTCSAARFTTTPDG
jgi:hypothetical protein